MVHILALAIPAVIAYYAVANFSFFVWHPLLMSLSFAMLMCEAILVFSKESSLVSTWAYSSRVNLHAVFAVLSAVFAVAGKWIVYLHKESLGKEHHTTWHGYIGLLTVLYAVAQAAAGFLAKYAVRLRLPKPGVIKVLHSVSGTVLFTFGCVSLFLGTKSSWFASVSNEYVAGLTGVGIVFAVLMIWAQLLGKLERVMEIRKGNAAPAKTR